MIASGKYRLFGWRMGQGSGKIKEVVPDTGIFERGKKIATRQSYGNALAELGDKFPNMIVLDADLAGATQSKIFRDKYPDRFIDCGICEGNMMSIAAGLSTTGVIPVAGTFAMFAAGRAYEQVRNSIGYPHLNVKIGATHAGISVGEERHQRRIDKMEK